MENLSELVKTLRERTGAGIMDCRKALTDTNGDIEKAIDLLRQKGIAKAAKKEGRETAEGRIGVVMSDDKKKASLVKLTCETDFVAKNEIFVDIAEKIAKIALEKNINDIKVVLSEKFPGGTGTVEEQIKEAIGKIGENIELKEILLINAEKGIIDVYTHLGSKLAVMVEVAGEKNDVNELTGLAHELAMQIAVDSPEYVNSTQIPKDVVDREREVIKNSPELAGKPDNVKEKIVDGKINAFYASCCLTELPYMRDGNLKVKDVVAQTSKKMGCPVEIVTFKRVSVNK